MTAQEIQLYNPVTFKQDTLQNVINSIFEVATSMLTASEFDLLALSARQYDSLEETALELDYHGKNKIIRRTFKCPALIEHPPCN